MAGTVNPGKASLLLPDGSSLTVIETNNYSFERTLLQEKEFTFIGGVDEVGRGPLAGPVVAACVILPPGCDPSLFTDSKKLSAARRQELYDLLRQQQAPIGIGILSHTQIDRINILQASLAAMKIAVENMTVRPDYLLVDGKFPVPAGIPQQPIIKGDMRSSSVAAASIVAKQERDHLMEVLHQQYPQYNFRSNKGYPTAEHRRALRLYGPCPIHRRTFKGVKEFYQPLLQFPVKTDEQP